MGALGADAAPLHKGFYAILRHFFLIKTGRSDELEPSRIPVRHQAGLDGKDEEGDVIEMGSQVVSADHQ